MSQYKIAPRKPNVCMRCGSESVTVKHRNDVVDFKGLTLEVSGLAETLCQNCGLTWVTSGQDQDNLAVLRAAYVTRRDEVRARDGLLTGDQIDHVLSQLGLSRTDAAALFGGGPHAFAKYARGDVLQSVPMDRLLRLTLGFGHHALRFLRNGCDPSLTLYAAGFVPHAVTTSATSYQWEITPANDDVAGATPVKASPGEAQTMYVM